MEFIENKFLVDNSEKKKLMNSPMLFYIIKKLTLAQVKMHWKL